MTARPRARPDVDGAPRPLPCVFCEKAVRPYEPVLSTNFFLPRDTRVAHAPAHLACLVEAIAGEAARTVLTAIKEGTVDVGVERGEDAPMGDVIAAIVERFARGEDA